MAGNYGSACKWYGRLLQNINISDEQNIPSDSKRLHMPTLTLTSKPGKLPIPGFAEGIREYADDVRIEEMDTRGDWVQLECRDEVNRLLEEFFVEVS